MPLAITVRVDFQDSKGKSSFTKVRVPNGFLLADYLEAGQAISQMFSDMSVARITRASVCLPLDLSLATIRATALAGADIAQKAFFQFASVVPGFRNRIKFPTLDETKVPVGSDLIDQSDVDVLAFTTAMTDGIVVTGGTIAPVDDRENDLVSVDFAREHFRKR